MNIEKAIKIKQRTGEELENTDPADIDEADDLSIEALKRLRINRDYGGNVSVYLLPGETKE